MTIILDILWVMSVCMPRSHDATQHVMGGGHEHHLTVIDKSHKKMAGGGIDARLQSLTAPARLACLAD